MQGQLRALRYRAHSVLPILLPKDDSQRTRIGWCVPSIGHRARSRAPNAARRGSTERLDTCDDSGLIREREAFCKLRALGFELGTKTRADVREFGSRVAAVNAERDDVLAADRLDRKRVWAWRY